MDAGALYTHFYYVTMHLLCIKKHIYLLFYLKNFEFTLFGKSGGIDFNGGRDMSPTLMHFKLERINCEFNRSIF